MLVWLVVQAIFNRPTHNLGATGKAQFGQDVGDVLLHGTLVQDEFSSNLTIGFILS